MKKEFGNYYLGLDIGTDSVGWAVTDTEYNVLKFNGKPMWGVRLFKEGNTAAERRQFRTARRRQARRVERTKLLQELFECEIIKKDTEFFQRLNDSKFYEDDKVIKQKNTLFNDADYNDKNYHMQYPTIYHLRNALLQKNDITDVRLLYLAVAHIIKNRGHFLFEGDSYGKGNSFDVLFEKLNFALENIGVKLECNCTERLSECIKTKLNITNKKKQLSEIIKLDTKQQKEWIALIAGAKVKLAALFEDEELSECEVSSISLGSGFDENYDAISSVLEDRIIALDCAKAIYDWGILSDILNEKDFLSQAKVSIYEKHAYDLKCLKKMVRKYIPDKYNLIFKDVSASGNYVSYVGMNKKNGSKVVVESKKVAQGDFCAYISKHFKGIENNNDETLNYILCELDKATLLPKQSSKDNSVIPYQLNKVELSEILKNAKEHFVFLNETDEKGLSVADKIEKLLTFKIPYYVGPLNDAHKSSGNCWIVKRSNEKVLPWNFEEVIDTEKSAEAFIRRMTNKCTYLVGEDVLPKDSVLYSKFTTLNELNNVQINGVKLSIELKQKIFEDLFLIRKKVKGKDLVNYLKKEGLFDETTDVLSGFDKDFKSSMNSYISIKTILGERYTEDYAEEVIKAITLFGDDRKLLKKRLSHIGGCYFSAEEVDKLSKLKFSGWGRFSKDFLKSVPDYDKNSGEIMYMSIMDALYNTNENLMQLLSDKHTFVKEIAIRNAAINDMKAFSYEGLVKDLYASPAVKRSIWQAMTIIKEIVKITGNAPEKIFVEMAREHQTEKKRTVSRKNQLLDLYKTCAKEVPDLYDSLKNCEEMVLRADKLYLYYTQMGRCMYTGEIIDLDRLMDNTVYDIDHIYPQSKVKDDSLDNRVLVKKQANLEKSDKYPIPQEFRTKNNITLWKLLLSKKLISRKKYERLTRVSGFTNEELAGFIARQLVETRQSTKAIAEILNKVYPQTDVVYVKAGNVADFKRDFGLIKVREVNDYHHAKDAYVNIVVGNVYDAKFTKNPLNFINSKNRESYSMRRMFDYDVIRGETVAWKVGEDGTITNVKKTYYKNNVLFTRHSYEEGGALFDIQPMKKGKGQFPLKSSDERMHNIDRYGGYNKISSAYFCLVECVIKGKKQRSIEYVPVYLSEDIKKKQEILINYLKKSLGTETVKVLIPKIKIDTLFCIDGFYMHISGRQGSRLLMKNAMQLILDKDMYEYSKIIVKYCEYIGKYNSAIDPNSYDEDLCYTNNIALFKILKEKATKHYTYKFGTFGNNMSLEKFQQLSLKEQILVLKNLLSIFKCDSVYSDMSVVGAEKTAGLILISKNISKLEKISIVNQSPSGLFTSVVDLKKL